MSRLYFNCREEWRKAEVFDLMSSMILCRSKTILLSVCLTSVFTALILRWKMHASLIGQAEWVNIEVRAIFIENISSEESWWISVHF